MRKAAHVAQQKPSNSHHCHWPNCPLIVRPELYMCKTHWFRIPAPLRVQIWQAYVPGQEVTKTPSAEYIRVAKEVQDWIKAQEAKQDQSSL